MRLAVDAKYTSVMMNVAIPKNDKRTMRSRRAVAELDGLPAAGFAASSATFFLTLFRWLQTRKEQIVMKIPVIMNGKKIRMTSS